MEFYNFVNDLKKPILMLANPISISKQNEINSVASRDFSAILIENEEKKQFEGDGLCLTFINVVYIWHKYIFFIFSFSN